MQWPWSFVASAFVTATPHRLCPYLSRVESNLFSNYCASTNHKYSNLITQQQTEMSPPSMPPTTTNGTTKPSAQEKLSKLRAVMKQHSIQALYVPSEDAHSNEYIAPSDARRAFISGFTGSAGKKVAFYFTDRHCCYYGGRGCVVDGREVLFAGREAT